MMDVFGAAGPDLILMSDNATVPDDTFAFFSIFGPAVKIAVPGVNILSTYNGTGYEVVCGTSMATPYVSGAQNCASAECLRNPL